ncbi:MAG: hypothetical protein HQ546_11335 [Planctomycetes bacterium]|nr:hypothetical protein [Planctomycetota bacterium]
MLTYRPEFLQQETATPRPAGMVFDPPSLAQTNAFGRSEVAGVNLNSRVIFAFSPGYVDAGERIYYRLYYSDRQSSQGGTFTGRGGSSGSGNLQRVFRYDRMGVQLR